MSKNNKSKSSLPFPYQRASVFDDPPRKNVLLLCCMDQRLLDDTVRFMNFLNLQNRYDQITLAGGAMGVRHLPEEPPHASAKWWEVFTAHLVTAINKLHRPIKDVFLVDHLDCGAYKELHPDKKIAKEYKNASLDRMRELHEFELSSLAKWIQQFCAKQFRLAKIEYRVTKMTCVKGKKCWKRIKEAAWEKVKAWKNIRVSCFIMDLNGNVTQFFVPKEEQDALKRHV